MQHHRFWSWFRGLLVWIFLTCVLLVWNRGFHLFSWWTWANYREGHPDKSALSLLIFGGITYFAVQSQRGTTTQKPRVDFDKASRTGFLLLAVVFLWMFWNFDRTLSVSMDGPVNVEGSVSVDGGDEAVKVEIEQ